MSPRSLTCPEETNAGCPQCGKKVGRRVKSLQCDACDRWIHCKCAEIDDELYKCLQKSESAVIKIICPPCEVQRNQQAERSDTTVLDVDVTCIPTTHAPECSTPTTQAKAPTSYRTETRTFSEVASTAAAATAPPNPPTEVPVNGRSRRNRRRGATETAAVTTAKAPTANHESRSAATQRGSQEPPQTAEGKARREEPPRDQCLILLNLPEAASNKPQERLDHDLTEIHTCLSKLFTADEGVAAASIRVRAAFRLGKRPEADAGPRPLKVVLGNKGEAAEILRRTHRLRGQTARILRDLSHEDRSKLREALRELQERRARGEEGLFIRDFRVCRRRLRLCWTPLALPRQEQRVPRSLEAATSHPKEGVPPSVEAPSC